MVEFDPLTDGVAAPGRPDDPTLDAIHEASMRIVERAGIQLNHERAREVFAAHGASVDDEHVVTVPRELVAECVAGAPASFTLHARNPDNDVRVGGDGPPVRAPGYGPSHVLPADGERRPATLADYERLLRLAQTEPAITCAGYSLCEPVDIDRERGHVTMLDRTLTLSDKPVMGPTYGAERARDCMAMVGAAVGDPALSRPYVAGLVNTVPPRSIGRRMLGGLLTYAEHGQPPVVSSFTMAGASGPPTLAASMAQANAENLVAITLAQLVNPGTPVVYGVPSATVDPRHGSLSIGGPESALFAALAAAMADYYDLPSRGGGGLSDAKTVDYQSGAESTLLQAVTAGADVDFVLNAAGVLASYETVSPAKFVLDCETLRALDRVHEGVAVDDADLSVEALSAVDPAGHFLDDRPDGPTGEFYSPAVADKRSHADWTAAGRRSAVDRAGDHVDRRLAAYERPSMADAVRRELDACVAARGPDG